MTLQIAGQLLVHVLIKDRATLTIFFGPRIPTVVLQPCRRKKIKKKKIHKSVFFLVRHFCADFAHFDGNTTDLVKKILHFWHVGGQNKKKRSNVSFFSSPGTFSARRRNRGPKNIVSIA